MGAFLLKNLFPSYLEREFERILKILPVTEMNPHVGDKHFAKIKEDIVGVDARIYNSPLSLDVNAEDIEHRMLCALYTKHHDGHVRQKYLGNILNLDDEWMPPFVFSLLGEYVVEIITIIDQNKELLAKKDSYISFIKGNTSYLKLIEARCISYWDCYYRPQYSSKSDYPGLSCLNYFRQSVR